MGPSSALHAALQPPELPKLPNYPRRSFLSPIPSSSFTLQNPLAQILHLTASPSPPRPGPDPLRHKAAQELHDHLADLSNIPDMPLPLCAIVDFQMGWTKEVFWKFHVPVIGFFTFGAYAAAMEWGAWKVRAGDIRPDELRLIPGLPDHMALNISDIKRRPAGPPRGGANHPPGGGGGGGPPKPGDRPPWVPEIEGSVALMFNTCDFLERPFIEYMKTQMGMPVWGVGPLLPETYWKPSDSLLLPDRPMKPHHCRNQTTLKTTLQVGWTQSPAGPEVGPTVEEYPHLAIALEESTRPFIWVIQSRSGDGYYPEGLNSKAGERGLIICGWAPQVLLSHKSTGGFLSHCGWNSTVEAIGRGVPILGWPIREMVKKEDIVEGIERLMGDEGVKRQAMEIGKRLEDGFLASSVAALDAKNQLRSLQNSLMGQSIMVQRQLFTRVFCLLKIVRFDGVFSCESESAKQAEYVSITQYYGGIVFALVVLQ
ncbi:UDP-glucosyl transferase 73C7 [Prunus dulcis]|uniref:UDP-glucosyl transferase 73C7 n=1 Tax=Prunus dulcis TaxID=3755 RepID=A0A4Y1QZ35_PRUDU|nr:UDP-glucosyl transferase 73C7 [Prunus dulcis]